MDLKPAMQTVVDELTAAGVRATLDGRDANPPVVQVRPPSLTFRFGRAWWDAEFEAWLITGNAGMSQDLDQLGRLITATQQALDWRATTGRPETVVLADGSTQNAYVLTWTEKIPA